MCLQDLIPRTNANYTTSCVPFQLEGCEPTFGFSKGSAGRLNIWISIKGAQGVGNPEVRRFAFAAQLASCNSPSEARSTHNKVVDGTHHATALCAHVTPDGLNLDDSMTIRLHLTNEQHRWCQSYGGLRGRSPLPHLRPQLRTTTRVAQPTYRFGHHVHVEPERAQLAPPGRLHHLPPRTTTTMSASGINTAAGAYGTRRRRDGAPA